jgi:4-amino-4-deoxy-L-arabinose transferase-like glycosyltransferase
MNPYQHASHPEMLRTRPPSPPVTQIVVPLPKTVAIALLFLLSWFCVGSSVRESTTIDETAHIGAGLSYLQKRDLRLNGEHPPLVKMMAALPLLLARTKADYTCPFWVASERFDVAPVGQMLFGDFVLTRWNNQRHTLFLARSPMILLVLLLGYCVFHIASRIGGSDAGLLCLSLYVASPVIISFGVLVLTDIAAAFFTLSTVWLAAECWTTPKWRKSLLLALASACAILTKFSTVPVLAMLFLMPFLATLRLPATTTPAHQHAEWDRSRAILGAIAGGLAIAYSVYLIWSWNTPASSIFPGARDYDLLRRVLAPFVLYMRGVVYAITSSSRQTYILGTHLPEGTWYYFPVLTLVKCTPGFLIAAGVAGVLGAVGRTKLLPHTIVPRAYAVHWRLLWTTFVLFTTICLVSKLNIGFRHFSIPLVFALVLISPLPRLFTALVPLENRRGRRITAALLAVIALPSLYSAVKMYPYFIPYRNVFWAGLPIYKIMGDSNVDFNQSTFAVVAFMNSVQQQTLPVDYYGLTDIGNTDPRLRVWNCQNPTLEDLGQWVVVSANAIEQAHNCAWLTHYGPIELEGGSLLAVKLPDRLPPTGNADGPPASKDWRQMLGAAQDVRISYIEWSRNPMRFLADAK